MVFWGNLYFVRRPPLTNLFKIKLSTLMIYELHFTAPKQTEDHYK